MISIENESFKAFLGVTAASAIVTYMAISVTCLLAMQYFGSLEIELGSKYSKAIQAADIELLEDIDQKRHDAQVKYLGAIGVIGASTIGFGLLFYKIASFIPTGDFSVN